MYSLGTIPREHFRGHAERQLLAVRRRVSDVIGRLGATSGPRTRQTTGRFRQGYPRLSGDRRRFHYNRDAVPGLALHLFTDVFTQKR